MPSPIGHMLAGTAVVWTGDIVQHRRSSTRLVMVCALLAALPDVDLLFRGNHRMWSHSLTAAAIVTIIAAVVTGKVTHLRASRSGGQVAGQARWRISVVCGLAYASHLFLDWLGADDYWPYGLQLLWPFSDRWLVSGWDIFRQTNRRQFFSEAVVRTNILAVAQELAILVPIVVALWLIREKTAPRLPAEMTGGDHPPQ